MAIENTWVPKCLEHLNEPYLKETDEYVVIGEVSSEDRNGYIGLSRVYTALVPLSRLDEVLSAPGGIGFKVESWGPHPTDGDGQLYKSDFWVKGPAGEKDRFEPLVESWDNHNKTVMMPDNGLLMCYGLCPRVQMDPDRIIWDSPSRPEYDVVSVKPLSHYDFPSYTGTEVRINRRYLEDYSSLKGCAVVAVFYEERRCNLDDELAENLNGKEWLELEFPGRKLYIQRNKDFKENQIRCQVWGRRLILTSKNRPISEEKEPELEWPDFPGVMTYQRAMSTRSMEYVYVSDQVLEQFEGRPEYDIYPLSGSVSYNGRWSLSYCHRVARDYIAYEIKKIYEGCLPFIIQHVHRFAVPKDIAESQAQTHGQLNIGKRADALIKSYLKLGEELSYFGDLLGFAFETQDMISLNPSDVSYYGWWTMGALKPLGHNAPLDMTQAQFLERCKNVYKLLEGLKEKPLRRILIKIGIASNQIKEIRSIKLLATLIQLCEISQGSGLSLDGDGAAVVDRWDKDAQLDALRPLFALANLRILDSHNLGNEGRNTLQSSLETYGIQEGKMNNGWGEAVDQVYDGLTASLETITKMLGQIRVK